MRIRFGDCVFDSGTRQVFRTGKQVPLSPKAFQLLEFLIERRPNAVSKEELYQLLWANAFVSDANLHNLVAELRAELGDDAHEPRFVRTVHRHGYAFSGEAHEERERPRRGALRPKFAYRLSQGPREIALEEGETVLGRDPDANVFIDHVSVSRRHARVTIAGDRATIEDLESKNGTAVRGERIRGVTPLADGDEIRLGSAPVTFRVFPLSGSTATAERSD